MEPTRKLFVGQFAEFLHLTLGPSFRILYYTWEKPGILATACSYGYENPQEIDQIGEMIQGLLKEQSPREELYKTNLVCEQFPDYRHHVFFIRNGDGLPQGVFVLSSNHAAKEQLLSSLESFFNLEHTPTAPPAEAESGAAIPDISTANLPKLIYQLLQDLDVDPGQNLNPNQKIQVITELNKRNVFTLKGAVPIVAQLLNTSVPTIYRYLGKINQRESNVFWEPVKLI